MRVLVVGAIDGEGDARVNGYDGNDGSSEALRCGRSVRPAHFFLIATAQAERKSLASSWCAGKPPASEPPGSMARLLARGAGLAHSGLARFGKWRLR